MMKDMLKQHIAAHLADISYWIGIVLCQDDEEYLQSTSDFLDTISATIYSEENSFGVIEDDDDEE